MMKKTKNVLALAAVATLALAAGSAIADSGYGYASSGAGGVSAQANVKLSVLVPKLILLRIGTASGTGDTLSWTNSLAVAAGPAVPANGSATADWNGAVPVSTTSTNPTGLAVSAWTNSPAGATIGYVATAFNAGGPSLADVSVSSSTGTGLIAHPGATTLAATSSGTTTFAAGAVRTGTWTYSLGGTPANWQAGTYTSTVTYTATSI